MRLKKKKNPTVLPSSPRAGTHTCIPGFCFCHTECLGTPGLTQSGCRKKEMTRSCVIAFVVDAMLLGAMEISQINSFYEVFWKAESL